MVGPGSNFAVAENLSGRKDDEDMPIVFLRENGGEDVYDLGYIGDALSEYQCCSDLLEEEESLHRPLRTSIADPTKRREVNYSSDVINTRVPLNMKQLQALKSMKYDVEAIQGPPGTGKSTVIYHIINSFLGSEAISLATCVQNKAVDAIAEKLVSANNIGFFVYGNEERLGLIAKQWTLDAQAQRHPVVEQASLELENATKKLAKAKKDLLKTRKTLETDESFARRTLNDPNVLLLQAEELRLNKLYYQLVRNEIENITSHSRVALCTIATAAGKFLHEEGMKEFTSRLSAVILDEAGTSSETKIPLLAALPCVDRIIAVGDHKQLEPFTNIKPHRKQMVCFDFQKGRRCSQGTRCKFKHTVSSKNSEAVVSTAPIGYF